MPVIKAVDLAYGRLRSPDLDKQEEFLTAFGMVRADRTPKALYMRGTDSPHHIHVTELGAPKYVGIALHAGSMDAALAQWLNTAREEARTQEARTQQSVA